MPGVIQVIIGATADVEGLKAITSRAIVLDGVKIQEPGVSLKFIELSNYEGSGSVGREGSPATVDIKHYWFTSPLPQAPVYEYLLRELKPGVALEDFETPYSRNLRRFQSAKGFKGFSLGQQLEDPQKVLLIAGWETMEDHTIGFMQGPHWEEFMKGHSPIVERYLKVEAADGVIELFHVRSH